MNARAPETRTVLLDHAEQLFAEHGLRGASLRVITKAAGANLAAVHYHFGSKDGLLQAVFERRLAPLNSERLERLAEVEATSGTIEEVLNAFFAPILERVAQPDWAPFVRLFGRSLNTPDPTLRAILEVEIRPIFVAFVGALAQRLPHLRQTEVATRLLFLVGALTMTVHGMPFSGKSTDPLHGTDALANLVAFGAAGLRAAAPHPHPETDP